MVHVCKRPLFYSAIVLSLNSLYREEIPVISSIKQRFHHIDIWLSDTDGRQAALAEAMRQGADGLFAEDELHRIAAGPHSQTAPEPLSSSPAEAPMHGQSNSPSKPIPESQSADKSTDPLLTAEELKALLQDTPNSM